MEVLPALSLLRTIVFDQHGILQCLHTVNLGENDYRTLVLPIDISYEQWKTRSYSPDALMDQAEASLWLSQCTAIVDLDSQGLCKFSGAHRLSSASDIVGYKIASFGVNTSTGPVIMSSLHVLLVLQIPADRALIYHTVGGSGIVPPRDLKDGEKYCTNVVRVIAVQFVGVPDLVRRALLLWHANYGFCASRHDNGRTKYELWRETYEPRAGEGCDHQCGKGLYFFTDEASAIRYWSQLDYTEENHPPISPSPVISAKLLRPRGLLIGHDAEEAEYLPIEKERRRLEFEWWARHVMEFSPGTDYEVASRDPDPIRMGSEYYLQWLPDDLLCYLVQDFLADSPQTASDVCRICCCPLRFHLYGVMPTRIDRRPPSQPIYPLSQVTENYVSPFTLLTVRSVDEPLLHTSVVLSDESTEESSHCEDGMEEEQDDPSHSSNANT